MSHLDAAQTLAQRYKLDAEKTALLISMAEPQPSSDVVRLWFWRGVVALAAALGGLGVVMWVAANWGDFGRFGRFGLLEVFVLVMSLGAAWYLSKQSAAADKDASGKASVTAAAMGLAAMFGIGALFAYFGQTYQTGADPWQLFALWALLAIPMCLALRSEILWMLWVIVATTGVALWLSTHSQHGWPVGQENFGAFAIACVLGTLIVVGVSTILKPWTGAGLWSLRTAMTIFAMALVSGGVAGLFAHQIAPQYLLALVLVMVMGCALAQPKLFDVFLLSVIALAAVVLLLAGLARVLFDGLNSDWFGALFILALSAAGLLAGMVRLILYLSKKHANKEGETK